MNILRFLTRVWTLIILSVTATVIIVAFQVLQRDIGAGGWLDMMWSGAEARQHIAAMNAAQKHVHLVTTLTLDMLFPLIYGGLLAGLILRFTSGNRRLWALPVPVAMIADWLENIIQAAALAGMADWLDLKNGLTPLKTGCVGVAILIVAVTCSIALWRRYRNRDHDLYKSRLR